MELIFRDKTGQIRYLSAIPGEQILNVLIRNRIPPDSVIIRKNNDIASEFELLDEESTYSIELLEGYDIGKIQDIYEKASRPTHTSEFYRKMLLRISQDGDIGIESRTFDQQDLVNHVESIFVQTVLGEIHFHEDWLTFGLSGGIDSTAMLLLFHRLRSRLPRLEIHGVTFLSRVGSVSPFIKELIELTGIKYRTVTELEISDIFHLKKRLRDIFDELMQSDDAHYVMYVEHHVLRRALENYSVANGISNIALGLHATDLLGGILNAYATGHFIASPPLRQVGQFNYIFPLAYLTKKELALYLELVGPDCGLDLTNVYSSRIDPWELYPLDRNFYYYLGDQLQFFWPGIYTWLYEGLTRLKTQQIVPEYVFCENCGAPFLNIVSQTLPSVKDKDTLCDVCVLFQKHGYLRRRADKR